METKERKHDMPRKKIVKIYDIDTEWAPLDTQLKVSDKDILVSVYDANEKDKKEYETFIDKYDYTIDNKEEVIDDLDNQHYSEGEDYED